MDTIKIGEACNVSLVTETALVDLLECSFPDMFNGRSFFKQEPHNRLVAHTTDKLVAQVGIDRRVINVGGRPIKITGVVDLCVAQDYQEKGIGTALLRAVEDYSNDREFIVLMADNHALYTKSGFLSLKPAPTKWLAIENLQSHSLIERDLGECFMYKPINASTWPDGNIDLLGYLF